MEHVPRFTCVLGHSILDDGGAVPRPVHLDCWESRGLANGYTRVMHARSFAVGRGWDAMVGPSLPTGVECMICHEVIA